MLGDLLNVPMSSLRLNNRLWFAIAIVINLLVFLYYHNLYVRCCIQSSSGLVTVTKPLCETKNLAERSPPYFRNDMIQEIRKLVQQPFYGEKYVLKNPNLWDYSQIKQATILMERVFKYKKFGVFFEAGALDGEKHSNTLMLERNYSWTGLLVEPDPRNYENLLKTKRKSWMLPTCIGTHLWKTQNLVFRTFNRSDWAGRLLDPRMLVYNPPGDDFRDRMMVCYPLPAILKAVNINHLDLLILDLESAETYVLASFPFEDFSIDVVMVECHLCLDYRGNLVTNDMEKIKKRYFLKFLMESKGYVEVGYMHKLDIIYAHKSLQVKKF